MKTEEQREKARESQKQYYAANKQKIAAYYKAWAAANKPIVDANRSTWNEANPERCAEHKKDWAKKNAAQERLRNAKYSADHPAQALARTRKRQAAKLNRTPKWVDLEEIAGIYYKAGELRAQGHDIHVDHIFPLQGKLVSGLHVASNLQIISRLANLKKSNRLEDN